MGVLQFEGWRQLRVPLLMTGDEQAVPPLLALIWARGPGRDYYRQIGAKNFGVF